MADQRLNNTLDEVIVSKGSVGLYRGANGTLIMKLKLTAVANLQS